ncbi:hypothetical protein V9K67_27090, partial [Paraflavisolibacter sp. H34]|uniref:hypothetical protein n=1 Tax=Huijunlia imazamoxiresistens TaxID=3127457 RepID=UPI00301AA9D2
VACNRISFQKVQMDLIFTADKILISTIPANWRTWQEKLFYFKSSLSFKDAPELVDYLRAEYRISDEDAEKISTALLDGYTRIFELLLLENGGQFIAVKKTAVDLLRSKRELLYWEDWSYALTKIGNDLCLWVYVGGIADMVREIKLSEKQIQLFKQRGKPFIEDLAKQLQRFDSTIYNEAVKENRKIF